MLPQLPDIHYRGGHQGFFAFNLEPSGMILPDAGTLPAGPSSLLFAGYAGQPGVQKPEGTQPVRGVGSPRMLQAVPGFRQPTYDVNLTLGAGVNVLLLLQCALRHLTVPAGGPNIPAASKFHCLPVLAVGGGAFDQCDVAASYHWQGRHAMINSLGLSIANGQAATANLQFWPVCVDKTAPNITGISDAALRAAGGDVFAWQHMSFEFGGYDYSGIIESVSIQLSNGLRRGPMRTLQSVAGANSAAKKANPLYRATRQVIPGSEDLQIQLNLLDKLPENMDGEQNEGLFTVVLANDQAAFEFRIQSNFLVAENQNATAPEAPFGFGASFMSSDMTVTRVV